MNTQWVLVKTDSNRYHELIKKLKLTAEKGSKRQQTLWNKYEKAKRPGVEGPSKLQTQKKKSETGYGKKAINPEEVKEEIKSPPDHVSASK